jgi:hypothetical protein
MTKEEIISQWSVALDSGSFLTAKHDAASLSINFKKFRTVLSPEGILQPHFIHQIWKLRNPALRR